MTRAGLALLVLAACSVVGSRAQPDWVKAAMAAGAPLPAGGGGDWARFAAAPAPAPDGAFPCPPPGFQSVDELDVDAYISKRWYVLAQVPLLYQPADQAFCTTADYFALNETDPLQGLRVVNTARQGSTSGPAFSTANLPGASLLAFVPDRSRPSELTVGFDDPEGSDLVGTQSSRGPYWVIATGGEPADGYDWAIVISGPPTRPGGNGCRGTVPGVSGLWLFSRQPQAPAAYKEMLAVLEEAGVDTSELVKVEHEGCTYPDRA